MQAGPAQAHQVMVECSTAAFCLWGSWYSAATAKVALPQAMWRMVQPCRSWKMGLGYMVLSPLTLSLPQHTSVPPIMLANEDVLPQATCGHHYNHAAALAAMLACHPRTLQSGQERGVHNLDGSTIQQQQMQRISR